MEWLFQRFLYDIEDVYENVNPYNNTLKKLCKEYGVLAEIHIKNKCEYGDVYTNEDFAKSVADGGFTSYDGTGYYIGTDLIKTNEYVDFDEDTIRSKSDKYPYVFWYNR